MDRFLLLVSLGYPTHEEELAIIEGQQVSHPIDSLEPVTNAKEIIALQDSVRQIFVDDLIKQYIVTVVDATRSHPDIALGASPRGSLALFRGSQALALIRDRDFVMPDDVKELTVPMLSHRIIISAAARMRGTQSREIIDNIVNEIPVPGAQAADRTRR